MNKLKKSTLITLTALVLCFATLTFTAFAAVQNLSSYETFKEVLLKTPSIENATLNGSVKLLDNGVEILSADVAAKMENTQTVSSKASYTINGKTMSNEQWSNNEQTVWKSSDSDKYNVSRSVSAYLAEFITDTPSLSYSVDVAVGRSQKFENLSPSEQKLVNAAIDMLMGDIKNYFTSNGSDITLNLQKDQIPQIIQLLVSVMAEKSGAVRNYGGARRFYEIIGISDSPGSAIENEVVDFANNFPVFTDDTAIQSANLSVTLDDNNNISAVKGDAAVVCTDDAGVFHTLTLTVDFTVSNIGTTIADTIDLTGKEIEEQIILHFDMPNIEIVEVYPEN